MSSTRERHERVNPKRLTHGLVVVNDGPTYDDLAAVRRLVHEPERAYGYYQMVADRLRERILRAFRARVRRIILFGSRVRGG